MNEEIKAKLLSDIESYAVFHAMFKEELAKSVHGEKNHYELMLNVRNEYMAKIEATIGAIK